MVSIASLKEDLANLAAAVDARRTELTISIQSQNKAIESLIHLRDRMLAEAPQQQAGAGVGAFDRDDVAMVDEEIEAHREIFKEMHKMLEAAHARQEVHARLFRDMAVTLSGRSAVLEQENDVLAQHPRLLERLAVKQLALEGLLQDRMQAAAACNWNAVVVVPPQQVNKMGS